MLNSISAQESGPSLVKMHLEKATNIYKLEILIQLQFILNAGNQAISNELINAKELYEAGMKALSTDDLSGALEHLKAAEEKLS